MDIPPKSLLAIAIVIGSTVGGYIPCIIGADFLSGWAILGSIVGGLLALWAAYKIYVTYM